MNFRDSADQGCAVDRLGTHLAFSGGPLGDGCESGRLHNAGWRSNRNRDAASRFRSPDMQIQSTTQQHADQLQTGLDVVFVADAFSMLFDRVDEDL